MEKGLPTPQKDFNNVGGASLIAAESYPNASAPASPVGYSNIPSDDMATLEYFCLIAFLISCGSGADTSSVAVGIKQACWRPPDSPGGGQPFELFFFFKKSNINLL